MPRKGILTRNMNDSQIVDLYIERDERAIAYSQEAYGKSLRTLGTRVCGDEATAEECENDTYLKAWNSIPPHEPRNYLFAFLAKIMRFTTLDRCKRHRSQKRNAEFVELSEEMESCIPAANDTAAEVEAQYLSRVVSDFLWGLSEEKRNIYVRRYWYMDSIADIAERYGVSEGKVKTILFRVRGDLRRHLQREGVEV